MEHLAKVKKLFIVTLIVNFLALTVYSFLFITIKNKNETVSSILGGADKDIQQDEFLRVAKFTMMENREKLDKLNSYFIPKDGAPDFLEYLEKLSRESGVSLTIGAVSVEPDTKNKDDFKELLRLRAEALGSWQELMTFLSIIENLPYRVEIERVSFSLEAGQNSILFADSEQEKLPVLWKGFIEFTVLKLR